MSDDEIKVVVKVKRSAHPVLFDLLKDIYPPSRAEWLRSLSTTALGHRSYPESASRGTAADANNASPEQAATGEVTAENEAHDPDLSIGEGSAKEAENKDDAQLAKEKDMRNRLASLSSMKSTLMSQV